jgi:hypothetical protein
LPLDTQALHSRMMPRLTIFGAFLLLIWVPALTAQNPDDLQFRVSFVGGSNTYRIGEPIPMQISYSSQAEKKYYGTFTSPQPEFRDVTIRITPAGGFIDPRRLLEAHGWGGDSLSGPGYVTSEPLTLSFDLSQWYRFRQPGTYTVTILSKQISLAETAQEGGGMEQLTLESGRIELEVIPADSAWVAFQLDEIDRELRAPGAPGVHADALYRLALLDTPASVERLLELYLQGSDHADDGALATYLEESSQTNEIIHALQSALKDPELIVPDSLIQVLAALQTRQKLGILPLHPSEQEGQKARSDRLAARDRLRENFAAQAEAVLDASIGLRSGPSRAAVIYQEWLDAERRPATSPVPPERLDELRMDVVAVARDLSLREQTQLLVNGWQTIPHVELLPLIVRLSRLSDSDPSGWYRLQAFQFWCQDWLSDCEAAILADPTAPASKTPIQVILLLHEAERPQLDPMLNRALADRRTGSPLPSEETAALVLRAGSRNLVPLVDGILDKCGPGCGCLGNAQGYLIGYLFRVSPRDAEKRLDAVLERGEDPCGSEVLRTLHFTHYSGDMIPVVTGALNSPNLGTAAEAALFLAEHAPADARGPLWRRLEALWKAWAGRSAELARPFPLSGDSAAGRAEALEEALASALAHAKKWQLSPEERERLRAGCLTDRCRTIADGKMFLNP